MYDEKCLKNIGSNIRFLRMGREISQQELADRIGISQTHLSNLECGRVQVSLKLLVRIANVLGCPLEIFLDTQAALDWGKEQVKKAAAEQDAPAEAYTVEEVRQLLQLLRLSNK
ncbi:helix-turn-helix domain-containing protein [Phascolarctobacterium sp.]